MSARSTGGSSTTTASQPVPATSQPPSSRAWASEPRRSRSRRARARPSASRWSGSSKIDATTSRQPVIFVQARSVTTSRSCAISAPSASSVSGNRVESVTSRVASVRSEREHRPLEVGRCAPQQEHGQVGQQQARRPCWRGRRRRPAPSSRTSSEQTIALPPSCIGAAEHARRRLDVVAVASRPAQTISARLGREWRRPAIDGRRSRRRRRVVGVATRSTMCVRTPACAPGLARAQVGELRARSPRADGASRPPPARAGRAPAARRPPPGPTCPASYEVRAAALAAATRRARGWTIRHDSSHRVLARGSSCASPRIASRSSVSYASAGGAANAVPYWKSMFTVRIWMRAAGTFAPNRSEMPSSGWIRSTSTFGSSCSAAA